MIKKKAKKAVGAKTAKKAGKKSKPTKSKKDTNPAEVREKISKLVEADATEMAKAVIVGGKSGQLATVKYLFEVANIFPVPPVPKDGTEATVEEDCLAKMLLDRLKPPVKEAEEQTEEPVVEKVESVGEASAEVSAEVSAVNAAGAESGE